MPPQDDLAARLAALSVRPSPSQTQPSVQPSAPSSSLRPLGDPPPPPTRETALADRLRELRQRTDAEDQSKVHHSKAPPGDQFKDIAKGDKEEGKRDGGEEGKEEEDEDSYLETDDQTLQELLADVDSEPESTPWEDTCKNKSTASPKPEQEDAELEKLTRELNALVFPTTPQNSNSNDTATEDEAAATTLAEILSAPSLPFAPHSNLQFHPLSLPSAPSSLPTSQPSSILPSVPRTKPGKKNRLAPTSRAGYTDTDARTWCIVCLDDATLRCVDCDAGDDVYCARCWHAMHRGPMAAVDDLDHRAVAFVRDGKKEKKVLLGA